MQHMGKIKIGLFGFGVVGQGIYEVVRKSKNANAEIVKICVRSLDKPRSIDRSHFTDSPAEILDNPEIDLIVEVIDDAIQIMGGLGYTNDARVSRLWRDVRCERIGGGTDEIMIYIAGRQILKAFRD